MTRDLLPFPAPPRPAPDVAVAALPLLRRLGDALAPAAAFAAECHRLARAAERIASPPAVFFHHPSRVPTEQTAVERFGPSVARTKPTLAAAWVTLSDLVADAVSLTRSEPAVRRTARAVPGLPGRIAALAADHPGCRKLAAALAMADDFPITVLFPNRLRGWRVLLHGAADLHQLHGLLADAVGPGTDPADPDGLTVARYQFVRPGGLQPDGTVPGGLVGVDHWFWGHEHPAIIPTVSGERLLLATDAPYPRAVPAVTADADVPPRLELLEVLSAARVGDWLAALGGRPAVRRAA